MNLGISSAWRSLQIKDGKALMDCLRSLDGLAGVELDYRIEPESVRSIKKEVKAGRARILSIHNFFPPPPTQPPVKASGDAFLLSSPDPDQRRLSVMFTRKSMEYAADLGARALVLHLGRVEMEDPMEKIKSDYDRGMVGTKAYQAMIRSSWEEREAKQKIYFETVCRSLSALLPLAERLQIRLGMENRYYLREIPSFQELGALLDEFKGGPVGYWHDMGHAAAQGNLGIQDEPDWLAAFGDRLVGIHLHDTIGHEDHLAPGRGETNFAPVAPFLCQEDILKILELRPAVAEQDVREGIGHLKRTSRDYEKNQNNR